MTEKRDSQKKSNKNKLHEFFNKKGPCQFFFGFAYQKNFSWCNVVTVSTYHWSQLINGYFKLQNKR